MKVNIVRSKTKTSEVGTSLEEKISNLIKRIEDLESEVVALKKKNK